MDKFAETSPVTKPPASGIGPRAPAPQTVKTTLKEARDLAHRGERHKIVREAANKAERRVTAGRFDPFTPSPESMTAKQYSSIEEKALKGDIKGKYTPEELEMIHDLYTGGSKYSLRNLGGAAEKYSFSGMTGPFSWPHAVGVATLGAIPAGAEILNRAGQRATRDQVENLEALIRDPMGKGLGPIKADISSVEDAKRRLAELTAKTTRVSPLNRRNRGEQ